MKITAVSMALIFGLAIAGCDHGHDHGDHDHGEAQSTSPDPAPAAGTDSYPVKTCVVSGEALGSMGKPKIVTHEGQTVKLCCAGCEKDFKKDPAKFVKMVTDAKKKP